MIQEAAETQVTSTLEQIGACLRALDDKKAENLRVLHLGPDNSIADYFIIATGTSQPHLRALRNALEKALNEAGVKTLGHDADMRSGWVVVDAYDVLFHLFTSDMRQLYNLEGLWKDAKEIPVTQFIAA